MTQSERNRRYIHSKIEDLISSSGAVRLDDGSWRLTERQAQWLEDQLPEERLVLLTTLMNGERVVDGSESE